MRTQASLAGGLRGLVAGLLAAAAVAVAMLGAAEPAAAQNYVVRDANGQIITMCSQVVSSANVTCHAAVPFLPNAAGSTTQAVTTASSAVALPSSDPVVLVSNTGLVTADVVLGATSGVTATTTGTPIPPGCAQPLYANGNGYLAAITAAGSTSLTITTGKGSAQATCGAGAALAANQPALNADGGALSHVTNLPVATSPDRSGQTVSVVAGYTITAAGSGGANGTFALGVSGGTCTTSPVGTFVVSGGALQSISWTTQGVCTVAPTLAFTASTGLTGASATASLDNLYAPLATNAARRSFYVFNPNASTACWGRFTSDPVNAPAKANAAGSFPLAALSGFGMENGTNTNALSVECATAGAAVTAWEAQ